MHQSVDYLAVGHVAVDITPAGLQLGGTVAYSALTAQAMGLRVGIITSCAEDAPLDMLGGIQIVNIASEKSTTFENIYTDNGRRQTLHHRAEALMLEHIPPSWRDASILHLAPIANEINISLADGFPRSLVCVTPQGWMRAWDENGRVTPKAWENSEQVLRRAGCVVLSLEDVNRNLELIEEMAHQTQILCVTEGKEGAVLHWHGDRRRFRPIEVVEVDATGAGDIFAAAFFARLHNTKDPWEAGRFATQLAARSVTRVGMNGIPNPQEIEECLMEVLS